MTADVTVFILTKNEEDNLPKALASVRAFAKRVVIVDSGSTDRTREIAREAGADVYENPWKNHAEQINWGLENTSVGTKWTFRLDADEEVLPELANLFSSNQLETIADDVDAIEIGRRMYFLGRWIRRGGMYPRYVVRLFRTGRVRCEQRLMDEHLLVSGKIIRWKADIKDDNTKSLRWWIAKHNWYSDREAYEMLEKSSSTRLTDNVQPRLLGSHAERIRWFKKNIYGRVPSSWRSWMYYVYRYYFQLGFLDGREGRIYHFLQAYWYRFLCDAKVFEAMQNPKIRSELDSEVMKSLT